MGVAGSRRGVRRGVGTNLHIPVNGHEPVPAVLAQRIVGYLKQIDEPVLATEVAAVLRYSSEYIARTMRAMCVDGLLTQHKAKPGCPTLFDLPGADLFRERRKACTACRRDLPESAFSRDTRARDGRAFRCRACRNTGRREVASDAAD